MGILLVGVVAALFFRNEPLATDEGLSADLELELNQRLRDRDVTVFLDDQNVESEIETVDSPQWSTELLGNLNSGEDEVPVPIGGPGLPAAENPNGSTDERNDEAGVGSIAGAESDVSPEMASRVPDVEGRGNATELAAEEPDFIEYTVQFGDTLSEISQKFLGSQNRFREIYEINKDRMDSPDRLRVGKAIRIPQTYH